MRIYVFASNLGLRGVNTKVIQMFYPKPDKEPHIEVSFAPFPHFLGIRNFSQTPGIEVSHLQR